MSALIPKSYFDEAFYSNAVSSVVSGISTLWRNTSPKTFAPTVSQSRDSEVSVFDVLALMLKDESLAGTSTGVFESETPVLLVLKTNSDTIRR
jgi:hypothetical protein